MLKTDMTNCLEGGGCHFIPHSSMDLLINSLIYTKKCGLDMILSILIRHFIPFSFM